MSALERDEDSFSSVKILRGICFRMGSYSHLSKWGGIQESYSSYSLYMCELKEGSKVNKKSCTKAFWKETRIEDLL